MSNIIKQIVPGQAPYASDVDQFRKILSGTADPGTITIAGPLPTTSNTTLTAGSTGVLNGSYKYMIVAVTGVKESNNTMHVNGFSPSGESTITVTSKQINVSLPTLVDPVIAYLIYRTPAGGATGSEKFVAAVSNGATSYVDNIADGSLGTGIPAWQGNGIPATVSFTNTTGSPLVVNSPMSVNNSLTISGNITAGNFQKVTDVLDINLSPTQTLATLTPTNSANFMASVYLSSVQTNVMTVVIYWSDPLGLQCNVLLDNVNVPIGSMTLPPVFFSSKAGSPISIVVTSATMGTCYMSGTIMEV